jgi:hypothetical protein
MTKRQLPAILFLISILSATEAFADAPKKTNDFLGPSLKATHVIKRASHAYWIINANPFRYIATPITSLEVHGWLINQHGCPAAVLRAAIRIDLQDMKTQEVRQIYDKIADHNVALARWQPRRPPCIQEVR